MKIRTLSLELEGKIAVILGDCLSARILALRLWMCDGVQSVICDRRRSFFGLLLPAGNFCRLYHASSDDAAVLQLCRMALSQTDAMCFLLSTNERYRALVKKHEKSLEDKFVITDKVGLRAYL